jgi:hypothetical protein
LKSPSLWHQFYQNLCHPRKASMFRFLRTGHTILYAFFLTLISAILFSPTVIRATIKVGQSFSFIFLPIGLIYYYIVLTFLFFAFVSFLSIGCFWLAKGLKRRVNGQQAWSLTVNSATWPTFIFSVVNLIHQLPSMALYVYFLLTLLMMGTITYGLPKPKPFVRPIPKPRDTEA